MMTDLILRPGVPTNISTQDLEVFLVFLFIPTFLGLIRNRKHIGKIFLLNIPAAFTFTSWFLLMGLVLIKFDDFAELKRRFTRKGANGVEAKTDSVDADAA